MPKYLFQGRYNGKMIGELFEKGAASRLTALSAGMASVGGSVEACYWLNGGTDSLVIVDLPDDDAAHAAIMTVNRHSGDGAWASVTRLLDAADVDRALARNATLRPPGA